jgi:hypothetical protein
LVFTIPIPKENSVSIFGILKLAGAPFSQRKGGALAPFCTLCPPFEEKRSSTIIKNIISSQIIIDDDQEGDTARKQCENELSTIPWNRIQDENEKH